MTIYLAADHAGFELKEKIKFWLQKQGHEIKDFGAFSFDPADDYPDFMNPAAKELAVVLAKNPENNRGIFFGGSGQGEAMVANRHKGVRAAVLYKYDEDIIKLSRAHNNANVLCLGARFLKEKEVIRAVELWIKTSFSNEPRHKRRIAKF